MMMTDDTDADTLKMRAGLANTQTKLPRQDVTRSKHTRARELRNELIKSAAFRHRARAVHARWK